MVFGILQKYDDVIFVQIIHKNRRESFSPAVCNFSFYSCTIPYCNYNLQAGNINIHGVPVCFKAWYHILRYVLKPV